MQRKKNKNDRKKRLSDKEKHPWSRAKLKSSFRDWCLCVYDLEMMMVKKMWGNSGAKNYHTLQIQASSGFFKLYIFLEGTQQQKPSSASRKKENRSLTLYSIDIRVFYVFEIGTNLHTKIFFIYVISI